MTKILKTFFRDESGAAAIKYGLIALLISIAIIACINALGVNLSSASLKLRAT
ncbi:Flp family type IVb pilin [Methylocystis parvus]|uniref:Flp family type IVb pilin n=1 Tax=Methylocystis parvus TaxID=134 RepID=A0A6B8MAK4_9HYPH|nr:Flp family type IVb pilin [Methylocystis parvus]QGM98782.1 Flp family type IVb pilin [Methylocystis parvus]WBK00867.1 Flp family type IVb pilin [Methylocystis parvus OBBP]